MSSEESFKESWEELEAYAKDPDLLRFTWNVDTSPPSSAELEEYVELCEKEFLKLTAITFTGDYDEKLDFASPGATGWNYERLVQLSVIYMQMVQSDGNYLLLELYHQEPTHLVNQFQHALALRDPKKKDSQPRARIDWAVIEQRHFANAEPYLADALTKPMFRRFLSGFNVGAEDEAKFERLAMEMAALIGERCRLSKAFKKYLTFKCDHKFLYDHTGGMTPLFTGLFRIISKQLPRFRNRLVAHITDPNWRRQNKQMAKSVPSENTQSPFDRHPIQFAFSPSGSGKTTSIFNELEDHYGFYMVACALPKHSQTTKDASGGPRRDILDPQIREGVSNDTRHLFWMMQHISSIRLVGGLPFAMEHACQHWWVSILRTRFKVFEWCREALGSDFLPGEWLSFQLNCSRLDPFLHLFRMTSLLPYPVYDDVGLAFPDGDEQGRDKRITRICIDEAQEDLQITSPFEWLGHSSKSLFVVTMTATRNFFEWYGTSSSDAQEIVAKTSPSHVQAIIAGISLNAHAARQARNIGFPSLFKSLLQLEKVSNLAARFPLVSPEGLEPLVAEDAARHTRLLQGRVKWTALYADRIKASTKPLVSSSLSTMATDVYETIIESLCARLAKLQMRQGGEEVVDKLLEAAISADILDRDYVFHQESDLRLVEEGFATVELGIDRLKAELGNTFHIVGKARNKLTGSGGSGEDRDFHDVMADLLFRVQQRGFTIVNCTTNLTDNSLDSFKSGFTIVDCFLHTLAKEIETIGFIITSLSTKQLQAKLAENIPSGGAIERIRIDQLEKIGHDYNKAHKKIRKRAGKRDGLGLIISRNEGIVTIAYDPDTESVRSQLSHLLPEAGFVDMTVKTDEQTGTFVSATTKESSTSVLQNSTGSTDKQSTHVSGSDAKLGEKSPKLDKLEVLVGVLRKHNLIMIDKTKDELTRQLYEEGFDVVDETKSPVAAKLAERVIIDAVIRFSLGQRVDRKMMSHVGLACNTSGLGHVAERYLAVCFSTSPDHNPTRPGEKAESFARNWAERRRRIIAALGEADNADGDKIDMGDFELVDGEQTVQNTLMRWLHAVEDGQKPSASVLIPHDYFGPDLVFALRDKEDIEKLALCSIQTVANILLLNQLKLGPASEDAVDKSSLSWACGGRRAALHEMQTKKQALVAESENLEGWITTMKNDGHVQDEKWHDYVLKTVSEKPRELAKTLKHLQVSIDRVEGILDVEKVLKKDFWAKQSRLSLLVMGDDMLKR
ncbi:hypothetical protein B0T10DRAFT_594641 [Thelonectria olida]|uniref:Uncharacterized protein n=1 Tax=Thelonectria olida TaxID=1576542 RepID=A0A9P8VPX3_9HYPO|nr:hypothetical protein B0T10DRAFT_594641 [Thelonectria olida]